MMCLTLDWFWEQEGIKVQKIDLGDPLSPPQRYGAQPRRDTTRDYQLKLGNTHCVLHNLGSKCLGNGPVGLKHLQSHVL